MQPPTPIPFGEYKPDLALVRNDGLARAQNTVPVAHGYDGFNSLVNISGFAALAERPRGAISGIDENGVSYNIVGTETKLYALISETVDASRTGDPYECSDDSYWEMAYFRGNIVAVNPGDDPQDYSLISAGKFARLGNATSNAPRARRVGTIGNFVMLGDMDDPVFGEDPTAVHWCSLNDHTNWPTPGTEVARASQSDRQPLEGDGGAVQRIVSGTEVGAIFQQTSIHRADYRGGDVVFAFDRVEKTRGLLVPAVCVPFGRQVFFLSEDGFYLFDYTQATPIGRERVDQTFLSDIDMAYHYRVSAAREPGSQRIWVSYPGAGNVAGKPNKYLCYDWGENRFSHGDLDIEWLAPAAPVSPSLDSPGILGDPDGVGDDPAYPLGGIESAGLGTFDTPVVNPGSVNLGAYSNSFQLQESTGATQAGVIETGRRMMFPGRRAMVSKAMCAVDNVDPTIQVAGLRETNQVTKFKPKVRKRPSGFFPLRSEARYHVFRVNLPAGFSKAMGIDVWASPTGDR